ncbi:hypothetical protein GCM10027047_18920 [Rhodococcus aerolatus]
MASPVPGPPRPSGAADPVALADHVRAELDRLDAAPADDLDEQVRTLTELHRTLAAALTTIDTA